MAVSEFHIPALNLMGAGSVQKAVDAMQSRGLRRTLIVTDGGLVKAGLVAQLQQQLAAADIQSFVFDGVQPNPTTANVGAGLALLQEKACDSVISLGGGSPHDCAKAIALVAVNGGKIQDYEGVDKSAKPQLPLVAINTTAGTASEMTRFCIITDESRHIKMAIVDKHTTPILSVNDPETMVGMPASLRAAVSNGKDMAAREQMAYAQFLAGRAFNNASLGYVHAMAHQLGGFYDLPHGVCNAVLLPHVQAFNARVASARLADVAVALGAEPTADAALAAIRQLAADVGIPAGLTQLGVKDDDIATLAANALKDACGLTNPIQPAQADVEAIYRAAL